MRGIEIRNAAARTGRKSIGQPASRCAHVHTGTEPQPGRGRRVINRLGIRVIEVELYAIAELLPQAGLKRIVVGLADGTPGEHAGRLIVQRSSGTKCRAGLRDTRRALKPVTRPVRISKSEVDVGVAKPHDFVADIREKWVVI